MYLFRGESGCTLHTGDFRWESNSLGTENGRAVLLDALKDQTLDTLYLDNTYCNPQYSFPSREVASKQVYIVTSDTLKILVFCSRLKLDILSRIYAPSYYSLRLAILFI